MASQSLFLLPLAQSYATSPLSLPLGYVRTLVDFFELLIFNHFCLFSSSQSFHEFIKKAIIFSSASIQAICQCPHDGDEI